MLFLVTFIQLIAVSSMASTPDFTWLEPVRKNCRQGITGKIPSHGTPTRFPIFSPITEADRAEDLVEVPSKMIRNIQIMDQKQMMNKQLSTAPWSDSYWPLYLGALGQRYNDQNFVGMDWKSSKSYIAKNSVADLVKKKNFDSLSPSEKYDFLLGIKDRNLTQANWAEGEQYFKEYGSVETWMGLCHGWAAASIMMPNPKRKVDVNTSEGMMTFYPSDIKALGTLLWAKGNVSSRFVGGRCNDKEPKIDPMGRPIEQDCIDNNPGTWHMAIVNQIGQFNRSFVMDATYDYQVWNQPIYGYQYYYYNPKTSKNAASLSEAVVKKSDWAQDPRKGVRSPSTEYMVGIKMIVTYVVENSPNTQENQETEFTTAEYDYDLELNSKLDIVGGEWYSDNHPDFLWVPEAKTFPRTYGDSSSVKVDLNNLSPEVKKAAAQNASIELPFGAVVRAFFKESSKN
jgi:hypothetical protein